MPASKSNPTRPVRLRQRWGADPGPAGSRRLLAALGDFVHLVALQEASWAAAALTILRATTAAVTEVLAAEFDVEVGA